MTVIWNSLLATLRTAILSPLTFARHLKVHLFGRSAARLMTIYDALCKPPHHHHHYHHYTSTSQRVQKDQWVCYFNPRKFVGRQDKWERKYTGPFLIVDTPSPVTVQLQRRKGAKTMTVHTDKVKPFLGEVRKCWLADEPSSDVRQIPERADEET